jgi:peptide/nickel transport system permease protein
MRYILRRSLFYVVALWASVTFNFVIPRLMPGNPAEAYIAKVRASNVTPQLLHALEAEFGVNTTIPIWKQYLSYVGDVLTGHLGVSSYNFPTPVSTILVQGLPWTIGLVGAALIISFAIGTLIGILIAWKRGSWLDVSIPPFLTFISAIPYFWMALGLVYLLAVTVSVFPTDGGYDAYTTNIGWNIPFIMSVFYHALLPVITLVLGTLSGWVLTMRNTMVTTIAEDYVLMAEAKGLSTRRVVFNYAARNAILPSITSFAISLGLVVNGALLTEIVFNYPGIGYALFQAVQNSDYALVEGCFLVIAIAVLVANFLSELVYAFLDPRVRQGRS